MSKNLFLKALRTYKSCNDLPLRNFLLVTSSGDYKFLYKWSDFIWFDVPESHDLSNLWSDLILEYGRLDNNLQIDESFQNQKILNQYENSFVFVKALIRILTLVSPDSENENYSGAANDAIKTLDKLGYKIDVSSTKNYAKSITAADKRANSIITRINILRNEISGNQSGENESASFDGIMSALSAALKFRVSEQITVARYCEYKKVLTKNPRNGT